MPTLEARGFRIESNWTTGENARIEAVEKRFDALETCTVRVLEKLVDIGNALDIAIASTERMQKLLDGDSK